MFSPCQCGKEVRSLSNSTTTSVLQVTGFQVKSTSFNLNHSNHLFWFLTYTVTKRHIFGLSIMTHSDKKSPTNYLSANTRSLIRAGHLSIWENRVVSRSPETTLYPSKWDFLNGFHKVVPMLTKIEIYRLELSTTFALNLSRQVTGAGHVLEEVHQCSGVKQKFLFTDPTFTYQLVHHKHQSLITLEASLE